MLKDLNSVFSGATAADGTITAQAITATANSTNVIDLRAVGGLPALADEGIEGTDLYFNVNVTQAFNNLTSLTIALVSSAAAALTAPTTHYTKTVVLAGLTAGANVIRVQLPSDDYLRYLGVIYTVTGTAPTLGSVQAFLVGTPQRNVTYPTRIQVL